MFQGFLVWIPKLSSIKTLKRTLSADQLKENIIKHVGVPPQLTANKREVLFLDTNVTYERKFQHSQG